jgi:hypothetical protein
VLNLRKMAIHGDPAMETGIGRLTFSHGYRVVSFSISHEINAPFGISIGYYS